MHIDYKNLDANQLKAMVLLRKRIEQEHARGSFMRFVKAMWPEFVQGQHHIKIAEQFQKFLTGKNQRLIVNMPPRHTKSEFASFLFPAWMMGQNTRLKIIQATHTGELAIRFGRKIRNLMNTREYKGLFPDVHSEQITKRRDDGKLTLEVSITQQVWVVQLLVVVLIY